MVQWVKDLALSLQRLGLLLLPGFDSWSRNFHKPRARPKKHQKIKTKKQINRERGCACEKEFFFFCLFATSWAPPTAHGGSQARGELELQPLAYAGATATWDPSLICNLHYSSWQCQILNPPGEARD